jgi:lipopolysaccharide biosynthesis glycosyltransferase
MSNLVLTIAVGELYQKIGTHTHPTLKAYADRIGADFLCIDESNCSTPHWMKFEIFNLLNKYERIIYLDTDLIVRDDCPDLFEVVPVSELGMFNEAQFTGGRQTAMYEICKAYDTVLPDWDGKYYNSGVMVISRTHKYLFKKPDEEEFGFYEQSYLNLRIAQKEIWMCDLEYQFNRMGCMDAVTGEERHASYIIHYAGCPQPESLLTLIPQDLAKWKDSDYEYRRHLFIDVQGGLGDQIDAEPAIRFMKENVYPDDDIVIATHFSGIFEHLDLPVYEHGEFMREQDTPYKQMLTLPGPGLIQWSIVSNLLCHTVDYISMALLRRTLPIRDKRIKLSVKMKDVVNLIEIIGIQDLSKLVLVHAGRHWDSKTFPDSWWQEVIDGLHAAGLPVCIIGKQDYLRGTNEIERGTVELEIRDGMIDTRTLLDLGSLIALISQARVLITNDSCPVHIAGAFENHIILIPTCKHPDHLLPFRRGGQQYWKATALYKRLVCDDFDTRPTTVHGASGEFTPGDIMDYLPGPGTVVKEAVKRYG